MSTPKITAYGIQSGTDRTCYITWKRWTKADTDYIRVKWWYGAGGVKFVGDVEDVSASTTQSVYDAPYNATSVKVTVTPIAKKNKKQNGKMTYAWIATPSTARKIVLTGDHPQEPPAPSVSMNGYVLTADLNNLQNLHATHVEFQIVDDTKSLAKISAKITAGSASCSYTVPASGQFRARARTYKGKDYSSWSDYSGYYSSPPATPKKYTDYRALSANSVQITWAEVSGATTYTVEYTDTQGYFDSNPQGVSTITVNTHQVEAANLATGKKWYFRVKANNSAGSSGWSEIISIMLGSPPDIPTVWSFDAFVNPTVPTQIYWTHNTVDGSAQTHAQVQYRPVGGEIQTVTINGDTATYNLVNTSYADGQVVRWRVRTAGVTNEYGDWSPVNTYTVIQPTTVSLQCDEELNAYPFNIGVTGSPLNHILGYNLRIRSLSDYDAIDEFGNNHHVSIGDELFSKYFAIPGDALSFDLTFLDADLENNYDYEIVATAVSIYGEAVETSDQITVLLDDVEYDIDAEVLIDEDALTASIHPFCTDPDSGDPVSGIMLAVYRKEFNGKFVNIQNDAGDTYIPSDEEIFVVDPHPSLDFARYRIVGVSESTGIATYEDVLPIEIGEENIVIQWDEKWTEFSTSAEDELEEPPWSGSMLKLPYNISISETYTKDSEIIKYSGRVDPVAYYGTNMETRSTWSAAIITLDPDLLYQARRLANYSGNVYVREPSGIGYWANVQVDIQKQHVSPVANITLDITKVEGGA